MRRPPVPRWGALLALVFLLAPSRARAEPVSWSYSWSSSPGVVTSDDGSLGSVTFLPGSGGPLSGSVTSGPGILAASLVASGPDTGLATFTNQGYGLTLSLTDNASHATGSLTFTGALSGTLGGTNNIANTFTGPMTQSLNLGATSTPWGSACSSRRCRAPPARSGPTSRWSPARAAPHPRLSTMSRSRPAWCCWAWGCPPSP
jgi:hypothetical protein